MKIGNQKPETGVNRLSFRILRSAFCTKIIFAFLLLLNFSGCLFMRPYTPSARLCDGYTLAGTLGYQLYTDYYGDPPDAFYGGSQEASGSARFRIGTLPVEAGISMMGAAYSLDVKAAIMDDEDKDPFLLAIDTVCYLSVGDKMGVGLALGPNANIVLNKYPFDLVLAAYFQYFNYNNFMNSFNEARDIFPPPSSVYLYAGFEFPVNKMPVSVGVSYTYYIGSPYNFTPLQVSAGLRYTYNAADKPSEAAKQAATQDIKPSVYAEEARALIALKKYKDAAAALAKGLDLYSDDYLLNNLMGYCCYMNRDLKLSYIYYRKALELNPGDLPLQQKLKKLQAEIKNAE